ALERGAFTDDGSRQTDEVSGARGGDVLHAPGSLEHLTDRPVHRLQRRRRGGTVVLASCCGGQLLERSGCEALALDADRVDGRVGGVCCRDRLRQRELARVVGAVAQQDDHATGKRIRTYELRGKRDTVVQRRAASRVDLEARQCTVAVLYSRGERRERYRPGTERNDGDFVRALLRSDERASRLACIGERSSAHRLR